MELNLTNEEQLLVNSEVQKRGKNIVVAYLLAIILGSLGIHRFYLGRTGSAAAMLVIGILGYVTLLIFIGVFLLAITGIWTLVDLFLIPGIINELNAHLERDIAQEVVAKRN